MFRTLNYSINRVFNTIEICVIYQLKKDSIEIQENKFFMSVSAGQSWFNQLRKNYLTQKVEYYFLHKKKIVENSKRHPGIEKKEKSLNIILNYLRWATNEKRVEELEQETGENKLQIVCKYCIKIEADLQEILPSPKNPTYQNSRDELSQILTFCKNQIQFEDSLKKAC